MRIVAIISLLCMLCGCATMKSLFTDNVVAKKLDIGQPPPPRYSENPQMNVPANRQYQHMTRTKMEDESDLNSNAGSMWVSDGQGSYLFTQNKTRKDGDVLNVKLEGAALKTVETKVSVIKKLLKQLEDEQNKEMTQQQKLAAGDAGAGRAPAEAAKEEKKPEKEDKEDLSAVQSITSRIGEKLADGNYRVKGQQSFMIGKREYKVIVTGLIRPEDYNDEGVSSSKIIDSQFDVVSVRRKTNEASSTL